MKRMRKPAIFRYVGLVIFTLLAFIILPPSSPAAVWISGSDLEDQYGVYGTKGVPHPNNTPGGRNGSVIWKDDDGNVWIFGGMGYASSGEIVYMNDLWKFDGVNWTWISGSNLSQGGVYGTKGVADPVNVPGSRTESISWIDSDGNLWLFGGVGYAIGGFGFLNDLWKYDGANWTWICGSNVINQSGVYGNQGVANPANVPGSRVESISWIDAFDRLYLFGGNGYDSNGSIDRLNDLWMFDGTNWTWLSGSNIINQPGVYGVKGVAHSANIPGSRGNSRSWTDADGYFCLFGGYGYDSAGTRGRMNDLWVFNGINWIWIHGSNVVDQPGVYGTRGVADPTNVPGGRSSTYSSMDSEGNLWLFGGYGYDETATKGWLNDTWKYDGNHWTWAAGTNILNQPGIYGPKGIADPQFWPGTRYDGVSCIDDNGNLWLFGGRGCDGYGNTGYLNDLWKFERGCLRIKGDLNRDCRVDSLDLNILQLHWLDDNTCLVSQGDVYSDCEINLLDFALLSLHWLDETSIITVE